MGLFDGASHSSVEPGFASTAHTRSREAEHAHR